MVNMVKRKASFFVPDHKFDMEDYDDEPIEDFIAELQKQATDAKEKYVDARVSLYEDGDWGSGQRWKLRIVHTEEFDADEQAKVGRETALRHAKNLRAEADRIEKEAGLS